MLTKTITYTDYNGVEKTEDFRFNLSKLEMLDLSLSMSDTDEENVRTKMEKYLDEKNYKPVIEILKKLVLKAYGVKSEDGKRFEKSEELSTAFSQHPAFEVLIFEMMQNPEVASNFMINLIPSELQSEVKTAIENDQVK